MLVDNDLCLDMPHRTARAIFTARLIPKLPVLRSLICVLTRSSLQRTLKQLGVWMLLLSTLMLSGCVRYDLGVNFDSPNRGTIVQHIQLDERLSGSQAWLEAVERRVRNVQGKTRRVSDQDVLITIPFGSGEELETKFNQFFSVSEQDKLRGKAAQSNRSVKKEVNLPNINSHLTVKQGNFLLLQRVRLMYDLDLRSLGIQSADGSVLLSPASLVELEFGLTTPWGARSLPRTSVASPTTQSSVRQEGKRLLWTLQPGQRNYLEAVFWLPSPLGIGALVIALVVAGGVFWKQNTANQAVSQAPIVGKS